MSEGGDELRELAALPLRNSIFSPGFYTCRALGSALVHSILVQYYQFSRKLEGSILRVGLAMGDNTFRQVLPPRDGQRYREGLVLP